MSISTSFEAFWRRLVPEPVLTAPMVEWCPGVDPGTVVVAAGAPIRIAFHRLGANATSQAVCFPDLGVISSLTAHGVTVVELPPQAPGRYRFCAPDEEDLEGWLVVEA